uniref:Lipase_3 domain-containing protein n=1 Tax=Macrostomum lignano TaxID=282301 RepID=A0A1I8IQF3_9PLAT
REASLLAVANAKSKAGDIARYFNCTLLKPFRIIDEGCNEGAEAAALPAAAGSAQPTWAEELNKSTVTWRSRVRVQFELRRFCKASSTVKLRSIHSKCHSQAAVHSGQFGEDLQGLAAGGAGHSNSGWLPVPLLMAFAVLCSGVVLNSTGCSLLTDAPLCRWYQWPTANFSAENTFDYYCTTGGQCYETVTLRVSSAISFNRLWADFKTGFGAYHADYFVGMEWLHRTTRNLTNSLMRIDLLYWNDVYIYARYKDFRILDESTRYTIQVLALNSESTAVASCLAPTNTPFMTRDRGTSRCGLAFDNSPSRLMTLFGQQLGLKLLLIPASAAVQLLAAYFLPIRWFSDRQFQLRRPLLVAACGMSAGALCSASLLELFAAGSAEFEEALRQRKTHLQVVLGDFSVSSFLLLCGFFALFSFDQLALRGATLEPEPELGSEALAAFNLGSSGSGISASSRSHLLRDDDWVADGSEVERRPIVTAAAEAAVLADNAGGDCAGSGQQDVHPPVTTSPTASFQGVGQYGTNNSDSRSSNSDLEELLDEVQLNQRQGADVAPANSAVPEGHGNRGQLVQRTIRRNRTAVHRHNFLTNALCFSLCVHAALSGWRLGSSWEVSPAKLGGHLLLLPMREAVIAASAGLLLVTTYCTVTVEASRSCCSGKTAVVSGALAVSMAEPLGLALKAMLTMGAAAVAVSEAVRDLLARRSFSRAFNQSVASSALTSSSSAVSTCGKSSSGGGQSICARLRSAMAARQTADSAVQQISPCVNPMVAWREEIVSSVSDFEVASVFPTPVVNLSSFTSFIDTPSDLSLCLRGRHPLLIEAESTDSQEFWERHYAAAAAAAAAPASSPSSVSALESSGGICKLERHSRRLAWRSGPVFAFLVTCTEAELRLLFDAFLTNRLVADDPLKFNLLLLVTLEGLPMNLIGGTASEPTSPTSGAVADTPGGRGDFRDRRSSEPAVSVRRLAGGGSRNRCRLLQDISEIGGGSGGSTGSVEDLLASASSLLRRTESQSSQLSGGRPSALGPGQASQPRCPHRRLISSLRLIPGRRFPLLTDPFDTIVRQLPRSELCRSEAAWATVCRVLAVPPSASLTPTEAATVARRFLDEASGCLIACCVGEADLRSEAGLAAALPGVQLEPESQAGPSTGALAGVLKFAGVRTVSPGSLQLPQLQPIYFVSLDGSGLGAARPSGASQDLLTYQPNRHLRLRPSPQDSFSVSQSADGASLTVPVVFVDESSAAPERLAGEFDLRQFCQYREAKLLGGCLMYSQVMESSWDLITGLLPRLPVNSGLLIVSGIQLRGRGRDENVWLAPAGSAQLSLHLSLPVGSALASKPSLLQHVVALAVLRAVKSVPGCADMDLKIKWPNDIHMPGRGKVCGILVKASTSKDSLSAAIGIGINVSNRTPGSCLAAAFDSCDRPLPAALTREVVTARVVTELEA